MRRRLPTFGIAMITVGVVLLAVGLWYHLSKPVIIDEIATTSGREIYPVDSDVMVHLRFSSNVSTTVYLEYWVSVYDTERIEVASNVTFLDTRFVPEELEVRSSICWLVFVPVTEPASMNFLATYEIPNNFYYTYIFLGMGLAGLGALDVAYVSWKRRLEARTKEHVFTRLITRLLANATSGKSRKRAGFSARFINRLVKLKSLQKQFLNRITRTEVAPFD